MVRHTHVRAVVVLFHFPALATATHVRNRSGMDVPVDLRPFLIEVAVVIAEGGFALLEDFFHQLRRLRSGARGYVCGRFGRRTAAGARSSLALLLYRHQRLFTMPE